MVFSNNSVHHRLVRLANDRGLALSLQRKHQWGRESSGTDISRAVGREDLVLVREEEVDTRVVPEV